MMHLFTLPIRYTRAKWVRSLMLTAVFSLGLASMTGLFEVSSLIAENFEKKLLSYGANILITPRQEMLKIGYGGYVLGDVAMEDEPIMLDSAITAINTIPLRANIAVIAPKMLAVAKIAGQPVALVGVDWKQETQLKGYWTVDGDIPGSEAEYGHESVNDNAIVAGHAVAAKMKLQIGQSLQLGNQRLPVTGILHETGSDDDKVLFVPLFITQKISEKPGQAAFVEVAALCSGCPIQDIVNQLQTALPETEVKALAQVAESRMYAVHFAQNLAFSVSVVILITACTMLVMSMLSAVTERKKEIGVLRAVGFSRSRVFGLFVSEAITIGLVAGTIGYTAGLGIAVYVLDSLHLVENAAPLFDLAELCIVVLSAACAAGLAAAFPAWRASLIEPADAMVAV